MMDRAEMQARYDELCELEDARQDEEWPEKDDPRYVSAKRLMVERTWLFHQLEGTPEWQFSLEEAYRLNGV